MSKTVKWIVIAVLLVGVIVGASFLYDSLSGRYSTNNLETFGGFAKDEKDSKTESTVNEISTAGENKDDLGDEDASLNEQGNEDEVSTTHEVESNTGEASAVETTENVENNDSADDDLYAAPDFTVLDSDGNEVKLSDFKGKPIVLNFWATWCHYCKLEMPDFNEAYHKYPDVQFLMVNATDGVHETISSAKKYVEDEGYDFDIFFDTEEEAIYAYQITGFPTTFFIDKNGRLIARGSGMLDLATLEQGIKMITEETK